MRNRRQWLYGPGLWLIAAAGLGAAPLTCAAGEVSVDQGGDVLELRTGRGMRATDPRVRSILAAHPNQYVVICVAGCGGKAKVVQILPRPVVGRSARHVPSNARTGREVYGPPRPGATSVRGAGNDIVCVAGCIGRPGQIVQRVSGLPPAAKAKPKAREQ